MLEIFISEVGMKKSHGGALMAQRIKQNKMTVQRRWSRLRVKTAAVGALGLVALWALWKAMAKRANAGRGLLFELTLVPGGNDSHTSSILAEALKPLERSG